jgi:hypothetical protein
MIDNGSLINVSSDLNGPTTTGSVGLAALVPQWCRSVLLCFITLVFFTGLPANAMIIFVHFKTKTKTVTEWFVAILAISDILSLIVCLPIYVMIMKQWWPSYGSSFGCKLHFFILYLTYMTSVIIIASIAVDRLWKSKTVKQLLSPKSAIYCCLLAFGYSAAFGIILTFGTGNNHAGECMFDTTKGMYLKISIIVNIVTTTLACVIIVYCYVRIVIILRTKSKITTASSILPTSTSRINLTPRIHPGQNVLNQAGQFAMSASSVNSRYRIALRTTKLMFIVTLVFIVSTIIPMIATVGLIYTEYRDNSIGKIMMFFLTRLYIFNNCANPYFYIWLSKTIQTRVFALFKKQ